MSGMGVRCPRVRSMHNIKITKRCKISSVATGGGNRETHHAEELFIDTKEETQKEETQNEETHVTGIRVDTDGRGRSYTRYRVRGITNRISVHTQLVKTQIWKKAD